MKQTEPSPEISLRALRSFHAIIRSGSVTAAAREMGLSQPAASRLLAQMEQQLGFTLFFRKNGRLLPTQEGLTLFNEVDLALGSIERINSFARDIANFKTGQLKLVAPPSFSEGVLPPIIAAFLERHPSVRLTIDSRSIETTKSMIASGAADAGFIRLPFDRPDLRSEKLVSNETVCVVPADSPLAGAKALDPPALRDQSLIMLGLGGLSRAQIDAAFASAGVRPKVRIETHTVGSACAFCARGLGVAIVNELVARPFLRDGIVMRKFKPRIVQEYAFVTSASTAQNRLAKEFLEVARRHFKS